MPITGCPRKQFTLFDNALILRMFITQVRYYTHFEADIASFKMSTHTLHRCQKKPSSDQISFDDENSKCTKIDNFRKDAKTKLHRIFQTPHSCLLLLLRMIKKFNYQTFYVNSSFSLWLEILKIG